MSKLSRNTLEQMVQDEWSNMHHNASISRHYPDFQNDYECRMFFDTLDEDVSFWIDDLQERIAEVYGKNLTFYSYGRQGATIAPKEYMGAAPCNSFGPLKLSVEDGLDGYNQLVKTMAIFRSINQYWNNTAAGIQDWWKRTKEANGYQVDIDAHDGKTLHTVEVWK